MQRESHLRVRRDGYEFEGPQSDQDITDLSWANELEIPPDLPLDGESGARSETLSAGSTPAPHEQQSQIAVGNVKVSLDHLLALRNAADHFSRTHAKLAPAREQAMLQRSAFFNDTEQYFQRRRLFRESQDEYIRQFRTQQSLDVLGSQHQQVEADHTALILQEERLRAGQLLPTEFYMQAKEEALSKASDDLLRVLGELGIPSTTAPGYSVEPCAARSSTLSLLPPSREIDPLLEDYYEKVGEIRWRQERADDIRREYGEASSIRIFKQDHDEVLEDGDEEFDAKYQRMLADADAAVQTAVMAAEDAKNACLDANLDPGAARKMPLDEWVESSNGPITPGPPSIHFVTVPPTGADVLSGGGKSSALLSTLTGNLHAELPLSSRSTEHAEDTGNRIKEWIGTSTGEEFPFDESSFEQYPRSRPIKYARRSEHDLRNISIDQQMIESIPPHVRERLDLRPSTQLSEDTGKSFVRGQRSSSESNVAVMEKRQDSGHGSLSDIFGQRSKQ
ncbi:hypothetical protein M409DRAFT_29820 [Zasmidium cellare ATCC 36951]|uniref:Uncharacterized protein n=1 Tax=Zasmidium cellare ATCC 36951 TaxID=1080233 RepID=A0A6A6BYG2_ZASCE|nr:uncharacterized protein M409DRAFT_29820 [Zasmidium cellare ATCC 36951]KAF2159653.1 hypothetical protein M409DRAFT_29820 [Zasmidium cellare ATCC 36951]